MNAKYFSYKFLQGFVATFLSLLILSLLIFVKQEYSLWLKISFYLALIAGIISILIPSKDKAVYITVPLVFVALVYYFFLSLILNALNS